MGSCEKPSRCHRTSELYAAAHRDEGFACELSLLKYSDQQEFAAYEPLLLVTGAQAGYRNKEARRCRELSSDVWLFNL
jgi:hypothetical protein